MPSITLSNVDLELLRDKSTTPEVIKAIEDMDKTNAFNAEMDTINCDPRVRHIVRSIKSRQYCYSYGCEFPTYITEDCMGFPTPFKKVGRGKRKFCGIEINGIHLSFEGRSEAIPLIQAALDNMNIAFEDISGKFTCKLGTFKWEKVWTDTDGYEYRKFDMGHGSSGVAGSCHPLFKSRGEISGDWLRVLDLPSKYELIKVDGYGKCDHCSTPKRPENLRGKQLEIFGSSRYHPR